MIWPLSVRRYDYTPVFFMERGKDYGKANDR